MDCLNRIFKMWPDERFVQGEKKIGGKGREGSFQVILFCGGMHERSTVTEVTVNS